MKTLKKKLVILPVLAVMLVMTVLAGCQSGGKDVTGMWYGVNVDGQRSTLEINEDGTWLYTGSYSGNGDWDETDSGTIVLSAPLVSIPFKMDGSGDDRVLSFTGDDPSYGNATEISRSTFYATEEARDAAAVE